MENNLETKILRVAFLNFRVQSGLTVVKQLQIEAFAKTNHCDIVNLQEAHISSVQLPSSHHTGCRVPILKL